MSKVAVITGASAGIGEATAHRLSQDGFEVVIGARSADKLSQVARATGATAFSLDVTDPSSVQEFCSKIDRCDVLINNAGGAIGLDPIEQANEADWMRMFGLNVLSILRMTQTLLPKLLAGGDAHIVNLGSVSSRYLYSGGAGYTASKHAERALTQTLRGELLGKPVRVSEIQPGMVHTDFSLTRFQGDAEKANAVYEGANPLLAEDIAECISWVISRPSHVNIDEIMVTPRSQVLGLGMQVVREAEES